MNKYYKKLIDFINLNYLNDSWNCNDKNKNNDNNINIEIINYRKKHIIDIIKYLIDSEEYKKVAMGGGTLPMTNKTTESWYNKYNGCENYFITDEGWNRDYEYKKGWLARAMRLDRIKCVDRIDDNKFKLNINNYIKGDV